MRFQGPKQARAAGQPPIQIPILMDTAASKQLRTGTYTTPPIIINSYKRILSNGYLCLVGWFPTHLPNMHRAMVRIRMHVMWIRVRIQV